MQEEKDSIKQFIINMNEFYKKTLNDNNRDMKLVMISLGKLCGVLAAKGILEVTEVTDILKLEFEK